MDKDSDNLYKCYILEGYAEAKHAHKVNGQPVCPGCVRERACPNCPNVIPALADMARMSYISDSNPPYAVGNTHGGNEIRLQTEEGRIVIIKNNKTVGHTPVREWMNPSFITDLKSRIK